MTEWINVNGYEEVPIGNWIVQLDSGQRDCDMEVMVRHKNISVIGGSFAFDHSKVIAYHPLPLKD